MESSCLAVIQALIQKCDASELPMILLRPRPYDEISVFSDDFDFLVDRHNIKPVLEFMFNECTEKNISFTVEKNSRAKVTIAILSGDSNKKIILDLWFFSEFRSHFRHSHFNRAAISYTEIALLPQDKRATLIAVLYLLHLHHKQKEIDNATVSYRLDLFKKLPNLPDSIKNALTNLQENKVYTLDAYEAAINYIYANNIKFIAPLKLKLKYAWYKIRKELYWHVPKVIPFVGPDGSGKSTIIDTIKDSKFKNKYSYKAFKRLFRKPLYHIFKSEPRNVRDEKVLWLVLPVSWISLTINRLLFGWIRPMILDRYFYDYCIYNVRSKTKPFHRIHAYKLCSSLTPRPYKLVVCMCKADIVKDRKDEMTVKSINSLYGIYIEQISFSMPKKVLFCNTNQDLGVTMKQTINFLD